MVVDGNGCSESDDIVITVNALPVVDLGTDSTICANHVLMLDAGNAGSTFAWMPNGETTQTITVSGTAGTETYTVTVTDGNGCSEMDDVTITVDSCVGIGEVNAALLVEFFPNPTNGNVTVNVQDLNQRDLTMNLYDLQGRVVFSQLIPANGNDYTVQLNLTDVAAGVYQLSFDNGKQAVVSKLVIQ